MMIEITCTLPNLVSTLDFNDKNGKMIHFRYGQTVSEETCNAEDLKASMEKGILKIFIDKGWAVAKKVNVNGAIIGAPVPFKGISSTEVDAIIAKKNADADAEIEAKMNAEAEKLGAKVEEPQAEIKPAEPVKARKKRVKKAEAAEIKPIAEVAVEGEQAIKKEETPVQKEDDFV
jgi:hypothetical protein